MNLTFRSLTADDVDLFDAYPHPPVEGVGYEEPIGNWRAKLETGNYRPEWMWVALDEDGAVVARFAFWGRPDDTVPLLADRLEPGVGADRVAVGAALARTAYGALPDGCRPVFVLRTPPDWREDPRAPELHDRLAALSDAGLEVFVERHGFRWTPAEGLPPRSTRLEFRDADDAAYVDVVRDGFAGTLDAHSGADVAEHGAQATAEQEIAEFRGYPSPREWWRIAYDSDGAAVGAIFPARNYLSAMICYITVLPEHRGHGYVHDLLGEMLHIHAENGAELVTGNTDLANAPMKAAFDRAGFVTDSGRIDLK